MNTVKTLIILLTSTVLNIAFSASQQNIDKSADEEWCHFLAYTIATEEEITRGPGTRHNLKRWLMDEGSVGEQIKLADHCPSILQSIINGDYHRFLPNHPHLTEELQDFFYDDLTSFVPRKELLEMLLSANLLNGKNLPFIDLNQTIPQVKGYTCFSEHDLSKRPLDHAKDVETAALFIRCGALVELCPDIVHENIKNGNLALASFFVENGAYTGPNARNESLLDIAKSYIFAHMKNQSPELQILCFCIMLEKDEEKIKEAIDQYLCQRRVSLKFQYPNGYPRPKELISFISACVNKRIPYTNLLTFAKRNCEPLATLIMTLENPSKYNQKTIQAAIITASEYGQLDMIACLAPFLEQGSFMEI